MSYLIRPLSYVLVIALGYLLKRAGFFGRDDHRLVSRIMVNITLPCAIVQAFDGFSREGTMFLIVGVGFLCALLPMLVMYLATRGVETRLRAYRMLNVGGYNIGCFSLPLVQAFFGSTATPTALRMCRPCSPKISASRSEAPLATAACSVKPSELAT